MSCERKLSYSRKEPIRQRNLLGRRVLFGYETHLSQFPVIILASPNMVVVEYRV